MRLAAGVPIVSCDVQLAPVEDAFAKSDPDAEATAGVVIGSFVEGGLVFSPCGEGRVRLVAVGATAQAGRANDVAGDSSAAISADAGVAFDVAEGPVAPATLALPASVEHGDLACELSSIGPRAFAGCAAHAVTIPATVGSIDDATFTDTAIQRVEVDPASHSYASFDGVLYDASLTRLLSIPGGRKGAVRIPDNTEAIEPSAFSHAAGVTSVSVDAGSATFSSRNGCLYDAAGQTLLWEPDARELAPAVEGDWPKVPNAGSQGPSEADASLGCSSVDAGGVRLGHSTAGRAGGTVVNANGGKLRGTITAAVAIGEYFYEADGTTIRPATVRSIQETLTYSLPVQGGAYSCDGRIDAWVGGDLARQLFLGMGGYDVWAAEGKSNPVVVIQLWATAPTGASFLGWGSKPGECDIVKMDGTHDHHSVKWPGTYYAHYFSIMEFDLDGGAFPAGVTVGSTFGTNWKDLAIPSPTRADCWAFTGWEVISAYSTTELIGEHVNVSPTRSVYKTVTIKAGSVGKLKLRAIWTSTFRLCYNGGALPEGVTNGSTYTSAWDDMTINNPEHPNKLGFIGWQVVSKAKDATLDGTTVPGYDPVVYSTVKVKSGSKGQFTLKAVWCSYLTIDYNGGHLSSGATQPTTYSSAWPAWTLKNPVSDSETVAFAGWRVVSEQGTTLTKSGELYDASKKVYKTLTLESGYAGVLTIRAEWASGFYANDDGGSLAVGERHPTSYASTFDDFTLSNPSRDGCRFLGWLVAQAPVAGRVEGAQVGQVMIGSANGQPIYGPIYQTLTVKSGAYGLVKVRAVWQVGLDWLLDEEPTGASIAAAWPEGCDTPPESMRTLDGDLRLSAPVRQGYRFLGWAIRSEDGAEAVDQDAVTKGPDGAWSIHPSKLPAYAKPLQPTGSQDPTVTFVARWSSAISVDVPLRAAFLYDEASAAQSRTAYAEGGATFRNQSPTPMRVVGLESEATDGATALIKLGSGGSGGAKVLSMRPADEAASSEGVASIEAAAWSEAGCVDFALDDLLLEAAFAGKGFDIPASATPGDPGLLYVAYRLNLAETGSSIDYGVLAALSPLGGEGSAVTDRGAMMGRPVPVAKVAYALAPLAA